MAEDISNASAEDRLKISSHFILSSPNGEVDDVIADVKTLMGASSLLTDSVVEKLLRQYNMDNYVFGPLESGKNLMCSKIGLVDGNKYSDPSTGKVYSFDHVNRNWTEEKDSQTDPSTSKNATLRGAIDKAVQKYMDNFYVNPKEYAVSVYNIEDDKIVILLCAKRVNLGNFWTGGWKSTHTISVTGGKKGKLSTHVNANVHYFEEGNVQLNTDYDEEFDLKIDDADAAAKDVLENVTKVENKFQKNLEEMYLNMHTQTFKAMRRFLPITKTKMDWNPNAHRIVDQLTK